MQCNAMQCNAVIRGAYGRHTQTGVRSPRLACTQQRRLLTFFGMLTERHADATRAFIQTLAFEVVGGRPIPISCTLVYGGVGGLDPHIAVLTTNLDLLPVWHPCVPLDVCFGSANVLSSVTLAREPVTMRADACAAFYTALAPTLKSAWNDLVCSADGHAWIAAMATWRADVLLPQLSTVSFDDRVALRLVAACATSACAAIAHRDDLASLLCSAVNMVNLLAVLPRSEARQRRFLRSMVSLARSTPTLNMVAIHPEAPGAVSNTARIWGGVADASTATMQTCIETLRNRMPPEGILCVEPSLLAPLSNVEQFNKLPRAYRAVETITHIRSCVIRGDACARCLTDPATEDGTGVPLGATTLKEFVLGDVRHGAAAHPTNTLVCDMGVGTHALIAASELFDLVLHRGVRLSTCRFGTVFNEDRVATLVDMLAHAPTSDDHAPCQVFVLTRGSLRAARPCIRAVVGSAVGGATPVLLHRDVYDVVSDAMPMDEDVPELRFKFPGMVHDARRATYGVLIPDVDQLTIRELGRLLVAVSKAETVAGAAGFRMTCLMLVGNVAVEAVVPRDHALVASARDVLSVASGVKWAHLRPVHGALASLFPVTRAPFNDACGTVSVVDTVPAATPIFTKYVIKGVDSASKVGCAKVRGDVGGGLSPQPPTSAARARLLELAMRNTGKGGLSYLDSLFVSVAGNDGARAIMTALAEAVYSLNTPSRDRCQDTPPVTVAVYITPVFVGLREAAAPPNKRQRVGVGVDTDTDIDIDTVAPPLSMGSGSGPTTGNCWCLPVGLHGVCPVHSHAGITVPPATFSSGTFGSPVVFDSTDRLETYLTSVSRPTTKVIVIGSPGLLHATRERVFDFLSTPHASGVDTLVRHGVTGEVGATCVKGAVHRLVVAPAEVDVCVRLFIVVVEEAGDLKAAWRGIAHIVQFLDSGGVIVFLAKHIDQLWRVLFVGSADVRRDPVEPTCVSTFCELAVYNSAFASIATCACTAVTM